MSQYNNNKEEATYLWHTGLTCDQALPPYIPLYISLFTSLTSKEKQNLGEKSAWSQSKLLCTKD